MSVIELAPVVKSITIARSAADAFRLFVHEATHWWPLETHALSPENGTAAIEHVVEPRVGGRVYEIAADDRRFDWGEVIAYEPGVRFAMTWQLGRPRERSGEVDVRFEALGETSCRITLTHDGWERMGADGPAMREGYNQGWAGVFDERFASYARA